MSNFGELVTSSVLARALALLVLFLSLVAAVAVAAVDFLKNQPVPTEIINFLYFGLGAALTITGINFGVVLTPSKEQHGSNGSTSTSSTVTTPQP